MGTYKEYYSSQQFNDDAYRPSFPSRNSRALLCRVQHWDPLKPLNTLGRKGMIK